MAVKKSKEKILQQGAERKKVEGKKTYSKGRLRIKLVRSLIGHPEKQREIAKGLGLRKLNSEVIRKDCPEIWGMIRKISYLVKVEALEEK